MLEHATSTVETGQLTTLSLFLLPCVSFCAGLVDAIAGGGGLLTVPALLAAGLPPHLALGTNKGQSTVGAVASFASFWAKRGITRERAPYGFAAGFAGSLAGAALLLRMSPDRLRPLVLLLLVFAAAVVTVRRPAETDRPWVTRPRLALVLTAFGLGAYDGFFGPGVGSMLIVANVLLFGDTLTRASGNAKVVNLASNVAAVLLFTLRGTVVWSVAVPMAAANALGAFVGVRLAIRRGDGFVRTVVLVVVLALVVKLGFDLLR